MSSVLIEEGTLHLTEPTLGTLPLTCAEGYVVTQVDIGFPSVIAVVYDRAGADGTWDETTYTGARAVTLAVTADGTHGHSVRSLVERLGAYVSPRLRPVMHWRGDDDVERELVLRGDNFAAPFTQPRMQPCVAQFVAPSGLVRSADEQCRTLRPGGDAIAGRSYDLTFPRDYPAAGLAGGGQIVNAGNAPAVWTAQIYGEITDPILIVNGTELAFDRGGGIALVSGDFIRLDAEDRTAVNSSGESIYAKFDFTAGWPLLTPGENHVALEGDTPGDDAQVLFCWRSYWLT